MEQLNLDECVWVDDLAITYGEAISSNEVISFFRLQFTSEKPLPDLLVPIHGPLGEGMRQGLVEFLALKSLDRGLGL